MTLFAFKKTMAPSLLYVCIVGLGAAVVLLLLRDIHGMGYWAGIACALAARKYLSFGKRSRIGLDEEQK